jgi:hypothetical protein
MVLPDDSKQQVAAVFRLELLFGFASIMTADEVKCSE